MLEDYFRQYGLIAIFAAIAVLVPVGMLMLSYLASRCGLRPNNPTPVKLEAYECGVETIGGRWNQFNFRYYLIALIFVIFDVEVIFLYPWAVAFGDVGMGGFIAMAIFILLLAESLVYLWLKGILSWK